MKTDSHKTKNRPANRRSKRHCLQRGVRWLAQLYPDTDFVRIFPNRKDDDACYALMDVHLRGKDATPAVADEAMTRAMLKRTGPWIKREKEWWESNITRMPSNDPKLSHADGKDGPATRGGAK